MCKAGEGQPRALAPFETVEVFCIACIIGFIEAVFACCRRISYRLADVCPLF